MVFIKATDSRLGIQSLTTRLTDCLNSNNNKKVLWIVSGGSNINITVEVIKNIKDELTSNLIIILGDERYGPLNHRSSNAKQLYDAGFKSKQANFIPVLYDNLNLDETIKRYEMNLRESFLQADTVIGQFGIGQDGHLAGILPHSSATSSNKLIASYQTNDYRRLTIASQAFKKIKVAYTFALGSDKEKTIDQLHDLLLPFNDQPAQILKALPEAYIYNSYIGDKI